MVNKYKFLKNLGFSNASASVWEDKSIKLINERLTLLGFSERIQDRRYNNDK